MVKVMFKFELISKLVDEYFESLICKDVKFVFELFCMIGYKELKKSGVFLVFGFVKFVVIKKFVIKVCKGINFFIKEFMVFKVKLVCKVVWVCLVKVVKDVFG